MAKNCTVTIGGARGEEWERVVGTNTFPVISPIPTRDNLPGMEDVLVYFVDLKLLEPDKQDRLIAHLADKFDLSMRQVRKGLATYGIPILAQGCTVTVGRPK